MPLSFVPFALTHASISCAHLSLSLSLSLYVKYRDSILQSPNIPLYSRYPRFVLLLDGPQQVKTVVLYGLCAKTPALLDEVVKMFLGAQIEHPGAGDCAKGAALLLAGSRGLLSALPVRSPSLVALEVAAKHRCLGLGWCAVCRSWRQRIVNHGPDAVGVPFLFCSPPFYSLWAPPRFHPPTKRQPVLRMRMLHSHSYPYLPVPLFFYVRAQVTGSDAISHKLGLVDRSKKVGDFVWLCLESPSVYSLYTSTTR